MESEKKTLIKRDFDEEIDEYDRLKRIKKGTGNTDSRFTKKAGRIKLEFDYEEDPYEPEKS